ncbi:MAG TPA: lysine-sensitive aspartokinase 3 [Blastocatellia bacterium]|nr:lysine-sensitive aspartokinase 3 [Blastocatellia bacterium]
MIVMKFGGTSVGDAAAIHQVAEIVKSKLHRAPVVVVSAMTRVTDALLSIARIATERRYEEAAAIIEALRERHLETARALMAGCADTGSYSLEWAAHSIDYQFNELTGLARSVATLGELTPRSQDAVVSFGERLSSVIVTAAFAARGIRAELVDSRQFVLTDKQFTRAAPDMAETRLRTRAVLLPVVESKCVPVAQGFIGSTADGVTTTIGRGGSDYSAAIIGAAIGAEAIEIWTDVDGLLTADPRVVRNARRIRVISFTEAAELSYFGAKVLHPSTVLPAVEQGIPVHIFNTHNPTGEGTLIVSKPPRTANAIKSIALKRGVTIIHVTATRMLMAYGFLRALFEVFERHQTSVDVVTTSEVSVSMTLDSADNLEAIERDLRQIGEVGIERDKAIVCVVGENLKSTPGVAGRLFGAIGDANINMISQGASEINLTFVTDERDAAVVIERLHEAFFTEADPAVFA